MNKVIIKFLVVAGFVVAAMGINEAGLIPWDRVIPVYEIPDLSGLSEEAAVIVCRVNGFSLKIVSRLYSDEHPADSVVSQVPLPGSRVKERKIEVVLSRGRPIVPDLKGLTLEEALKKLNSCSLVLGNSAYDYSDVAAEKVVSSSPPAGTEVGYGACIDLKISKGKNTVVVPDITGKKLAGARSILARNGLMLGTIKKKTDAGHKIGVILKQWPPAGRSVDKGTAVTIILNEKAY